MPTDVSDIRQWARENGYPDLTDEERLPAGLRAKYNEQKSNGHMESDIQDAPIGESTQERAPKQHSPSVADKAKSFASKIGITKSDDKAVVPFGKRRARIPVDRVISTAWRFLAQAAQPINLPVARVLDVQAPVAGLILEDVIKGTIVDRVLQPFARAEDKAEIAFALLAPPILVGALTTKPQMAPILVPMLKESLRIWIDVAGPKLEIIQKRDDEFEEKYGQRIDEMIQYFLSPPEPVVDVG